MITVSEIVSAIMNGNFSNDELHSISKAIASARHVSAKVNTFTMRKGQHVKFEYKGDIHKGEINKVNRTTITVKITDSPTLAANTVYKVPANMLELN